MLIREQLPHYLKLMRLHQPIGFLLLLWPTLWALWLAAAVCSRLTLIHADAIPWLTALSPARRPQIIYLDPMFPSRKKSASAKKEMVNLQELLGIDKDLESLLAMALSCASERVVIKRPRLAAAAMGGHEPNFALTGKSSRFDIYLTPLRIKTLSTKKRSR